ncbi:MAG: UDP-N-acetylmuramoyl-L-alanyl-D-glutamate--2,6-diaminopimelate ligase [Candidatus Sericytochromatia bacterium]|nr:MAG: UDP-N-acetylmuramoyl-L-alanyl-D-glutamate--2,6-diaminopimelate ligase [Candidatus Sericytochromatia bacterium]
MNLENLILGLTDFKILGNKNIDIKNISSNSKNIEKDFMYISLPGTKTDGDFYINDAIEKGAKAILTSEEFLKDNNLVENVTYILVKNRRKAFSIIASNFYDNPSKETFNIGVTGTNGKTTTTHLIYDLLSDNNCNPGLIGTLYNKYLNVVNEAKFTTPMPDEIHKIFREMLNNNVNSIVMEVSSHALDQYRVSSINYDIAVFTNITQDHLDYHKTFENYKKAKSILFSDLLKENGFAIINIDDPNSDYFIKSSKSKNIITYGINNDADVKAKNINLKMDGTTFIVETKNKNIELDVNLLGKFNVYNSLATIAVGIAKGFSLEKCKNSLEKSKGVKGRIEIVTPKGYPFTVVIDYAHTPDSLENILKTVKEFSKGKVISVFGCGGDRDRAKRPIMGEISSKLADITIVTSDNPRTESPSFIISEILEGMKNKDNILVEEDRKLAIKKSIEIANKGDIVVIAGKGHENYQIFKDKTIHFDDKEVALEFLSLNR